MRSRNVIKKNNPKIKINKEFLMIQNQRKRQILLKNLKNQNYTRKGSFLQINI